MRVRRRFAYELGVYKSSRYEEKDKLFLRNQGSWILKHPLLQRSNSTQTIGYRIRTFPHRGRDGPLFQPCAAAVTLGLAEFGEIR